VHADNVKYNTMKIPCGAFTSQVMMQGDMNPSGTFMSTIEDLFHDGLGKNICLYIDDIFVSSNTFEAHGKNITNACSRPQNTSH